MIAVAKIIIASAVTAPLMMAREAVRLLLADEIAGVGVLLATAKNQMPTARIPSMQVQSRIQCWPRAKKGIPATPSETIVNSKRLNRRQMDWSQSGLLDPFSTVKARPRSRQGCGAAAR